MGEPQFEAEARKLVSDNAFGVEPTTTNLSTWSFEPGELGWAEAERLALSNLRAIIDRGGVILSIDWTRRLDLPDRRKLTVEFKNASLMR